MNLDGQLIYLSHPNTSDIDILLTWENDENVWLAGDTQRPYLKEEISEFVESGQDIYHHKQSRWMICQKKEGKRLGCLDLYEFDEKHHRAGVGILIYDESDRKKGFASEALQLLIKYARTELNLNQLFCYILENNLASLALFKKSGFEVSGIKKQWRKINNEWQNEYMLQLLLHK